MDNKKFIVDILSCLEEANIIDSDYVDFDALNDEDNQFIVLCGVMEYLQEYKKVIRGIMELKTKTIELPVIPKWLAKPVDSYKKWYSDIDSIITISSLIINSFLRNKKKFHSESDCEKWEKDYATKQYEYARSHEDDIFVAIKYGYEVEDD